MENTEERASLGRKILTASILLTLLVILPAGSYLYMRGGFNWRKQAISELGQYGKIREAIFLQPDGKKIDMLGGSVCVVHVFPEAAALDDAHRKIIDDCNELLNQFGVLSDRSFRPDFKLAMIADNPTEPFKAYRDSLPSVDYPTWVWTIGGQLWTPLVERGYRKYCAEQGAAAVPHYYALTDTSGQIRRFYNALDEQQIGRMVEHIAMLLPGK
jgi:hypothetical protein